MRLLVTLFIFQVVSIGQSKAQNEVLTWKDHFSYRNVKTLTAGNNSIYAATELGAFKVDLEDNSITRINKTNKLSDTGISYLEGIPERNMVLVGYENGNLDILIDDQPTNLADIKNSSIIAPKRINEVLTTQNFAYICCEFGIVQFDLEKLEIKDTYILGANSTYLNVTDLEIVGSKFYATTELGLYEADVNDPFLSNSETWTKMTDSPESDGFYKNITVFQDRLYLNLQTVAGDYIYSRSTDFSDSWTEFWHDENQIVRDVKGFSDRLIITAKGIVIEHDSSLTEPREISWLGPGWTDSYESAISPDGNGIWIANNRSGLYHITNDAGIQEIIPNGPENSEARRINSYFENVWAATGGVDLGYVNNFTTRGINSYVNNQWSSITKDSDEGMAGENDFGGVLYDVMDIAIDPLDNSHIYASSWDEGLIEINNGEVVEIHNTFNSPLVGTRDEFNNEIVHVDGITYDRENNLWISNSFTEQCLHVLTPGGTWYSYSFDPQINESLVLGQIMVDRSGLVWAVLPRGEGILVFNHNDTLDDPSDDQFRILTGEEGDGGLPSEDVYSVMEDINGEIWIGTLQGVGIFYSTECLFTDDECDAQQILIEQDGNFQILLDTETITTMELDGGNRKWIGTQTSGAYLLSDDGITQIYHFTKENSPLLSNNIQDISFNFSTGEIFFATDLGVVSFIGTASGFNGEITDTKIYPNPVREDYSGIITIDGLTYQTDVRITDLNGNLVHSTTSEGGRAIWNGRNERGNRVSTGVYLVFATSPDGEEDTVGKIAVIN